MNAEIHTLSWPEAHQALIESQQAVFKAFNLPIHVHHDRVDHGLWMDHVLSHATSDVILFIDNDCVPLTSQAVMEAVMYAWNMKSFLGVAQSSNHLSNPSHIFAAPAFLAISREGWVGMGRPSCRVTTRGDVAEELSYRAEELKLHYRAWYPTHYIKPSREGLWRLGNYGSYGIGTVYANKVFHLYQGRLAENVDLFATTCHDIIAGTFSTQGMASCLDEPCF